MAEVCKTPYDKDNDLKLMSRVNAAYPNDDSMSGWEKHGPRFVSGYLNADRNIDPSNMGGYRAGPAGRK